MQYSFVFPGIKCITSLPDEANTENGFSHNSQSWTQFNVRMLGNILLL
jgi:hypothetical protein